MIGWILVQDGTPVIEDDGFIAVFVTKERIVRTTPKSKNAIIVPVNMEIVSEANIRRFKQENEQELS